MPRSFVELLIIITLLIANGLLAMSEMALVSARKARLRQWADEGNGAALRALTLARSPNEFLSTIQVGITLIGILAGAFAGATISEELAEHLKRIPVMAAYAEAASMAIVVFAITYLSLILGELVPKRFALTSPEKIACMASLPLQWLSVLVKPIVSLLTASSNSIFRLLRVREGTDSEVTEAEIQMMLDQATESGLFQEEEQEIIASVMRLSDRNVMAIMTPRAEIEWLDLQKDESELIKKVRASSHSTLVVVDGTPENVAGVASRFDIIKSVLDKADINLGSAVKQPVYVPESISALELLKRFREDKQHIALIMDEYGGLLGIVTRDDLFEAIVGELPLQGESARWEVQRRQDGSWLLDGQLPIDEFCELFDCVIQPQDEGHRYNTIAGFILSQLQRVPSVGDSFNFEDWQIEIIDMDHYRIDKVLLTPLRKSEMETW